MEESISANRNFINCDKDLKSSWDVSLLDKGRAFPLLEEV